MKKYKVDVDFESYSVIVEAGSKEEAEQLGINKYEEHNKEEPTPHYWVGDCCEEED